jgi:hypothetical protein
MFESSEQFLKQLFGRDVSEEEREISCMSLQFSKQDSFREIMESGTKMN